MDSFPKNIAPQFSDSFASSAQSLLSSELRAEIAAHILLHTSPNDFYDITSFKYYRTVSKETLMKSVSVIMSELQSLGWTATLSHGDTSLFIYTGPRPDMCW